MSNFTWHGKRIEKALNSISEDVSKDVANLVLSEAKKRLSQHDKTGGSIRKALGIRKSKFNGYIVGVFGDDSPRNLPKGGNVTNTWPYTLGGRAHFFEYGRSAPGKGKGKGRKPQSIEERPQPPRPFMRPAKKKGEREMPKILKGALGQ